MDHLSWNLADSCCRDGLKLNMKIQLLCDMAQYNRYTGFTAVKISKRAQTRSLGTAASSGHVLLLLPGGGLKWSFYGW
jgi:hypothetical protein